VFTGKNKGIPTSTWFVGKVGVISQITHSSFHFENKDNFDCFEGGSGSNNKCGFRHATPEEIKKWKEENEVKLPRIGSYSGEHSSTNLKWGCTIISIATIKELLDAGLDHITIKGNHILDSEVKQIKKFIEHNKL
jgi:hypothetical protein